MGIVRFSNNGINGNNADPQIWVETVCSLPTTSPPGAMKNQNGLTNCIEEQ